MPITTIKFVTIVIHARAIIALQSYGYSLTAKHERLLNKLNLVGLSQSNFQSGSLHNNYIQERMSVQKIAAMCILWQFFHHSSCSIAYMKYLKLKAINWGQPLAAHKLNATPIASSTVTNYVKCMGQCGKTKGCVAINFGPMEGGERKCEMLGTTRHSASMANITVKAGWTYVGPKV